MAWLAIGLLLLGILVGGAGMRRAGRFARGLWRPGAGMLALVLFIGSGVLAAREAFLPAGLLALAALSLSIGVRRTRRPSGQTVAPITDMSVEAAGAILGVAPDAPEDEIQAAYLRLIRRTHPDQGGTTGLAAQLNAARDTLLKRRRAGPRP